MSETRPKICCLSGNILKIIAAISMLIDHVGVMFFPSFKIFRILGRLAFPIFAFMIAEGCRYTKNRLRYFLTVLIMGITYAAVFYLYSGTLYFSILTTFTLSIMMTFALQEFKESLFDPNARIQKRVLTGIAFVLSVALSVVLDIYFKIDYGIVGCITPVLVSAFHSPKNNSSKLFNTLDRLEWQVLGLSVGIALLYLVYGGVRIYSFLAIPLLLLYSGKRGKWKMKYFFYVFYPAHLLALEGLYMLLKIIRG